MIQCATRARCARGFTLIELVVTVAIVALLATVALPMTELTVQRSKEQELKVALRQIREAIDNYHQAAVVDGRIELSAERVQIGYPKSLDELVDGVEDKLDPKHRKIYFLRRIPRDPFFPNASASAADSWGKRSYASPPDDPREGEDVFDVYSLARGNGMNGIPYREW